MISRLNPLILPVLLALILAAPVYAQPDDDRQVWTFYLSFWAGENTWVWNESILQDYPLLGPYNSKLPEIAAAHIQQAQSAGIDAFLVNWWGIDETVTTTPAFENLLDRAGEQGFKIAAVIDVFPQQFLRDPETIMRSLRHIIEVWAAHPAYLHDTDGRPVIAFAFQYMAGFDTAQWQAIRETVDPNHQTLWIAEGLSACCLHDGVFDGMYAFNMAWASGEADFYIAERNLIFKRGGSVYIPTISPGWDEDAIAALTDRPRPTSIRDREDGQFLRDSWNATLETKSDVILVVSWNEFIENSHIEPSEAYGTQSLDILRELITDWRGESPNDPAPIPLSYRIEVDTITPAYAEPSSSSSIQTRLLPGASYEIAYEDGGYYGVISGGRIVYAHYTQIRIIPQIGD